MTTLETLRAANALLSVPSAWSQSGHYAVDARGNSARPTSKDAVRWCMLGAIAKVAGDEVSRVHAEQALYRAYAGKSITTLNDHGKHAQILSVYEKAIDAVARAGVV